MSKVFLVEMKFLIPVVADDEDEAISLVTQDSREMTTSSFEQMRDQLSEGDDSDVEFVCREITAESLESSDEPWLNVVPYGDDDDRSIADRLLWSDSGDDTEDACN